MRAVQNNKVGNYHGATKYAFETLLKSISEQVRHIEVQLTIKSVTTVDLFKKDDHVI